MFYIYATLVALACYVLYTFPVLLLLPVPAILAWAVWKAQIWVLNNMRNTDGQVTTNATWTLGVAQAIIIGLASGFCAYTLVNATLDFWYLEEILGPAVGVGTALYVGQWVFDRFVEVELYYVGIGLDRGTPTGRLYEQGKHWVPFLHSLVGCPYKGAQLAPLLMPHEKISTRDGSQVEFGIDEEDLQKRNRIVYQIISPLVYVGVVDPDDRMREEFLEKARIFFSKMANAIGVKVEKTLFSDWLMLRPGGYDKDGNLLDWNLGLEVSSFIGKLRAITFEDAGGKTQRLFEEDGLMVLLENSGEFLTRLSGWGIGEVLVFTPNVNPDTEILKAITAKTAAGEAMEAVETRVKKQKTLIAALKKTGMSPDLAAAIVNNESGGKSTVNVSHSTNTVTDLAKAAEALGAGIGAVLGKKVGETALPEEK